MLFCSLVKHVWFVKYNTVNNTYTEVHKLHVYVFLNKQHDSLRRHEEVRENFPRPKKLVTGFPQGLSQYDSAHQDNYTSLIQKSIHPFNPRFTRSWTEIKSCVSCLIHIQNLSFVGSVVANLP